MTTQLKFYADTPRGERNKLFCWKLKKPENLSICLAYFYLKGFRYRAAWLCKGIISISVEIPENMKVSSQKQTVQIKTVQIKSEQWKPLFSISYAIHSESYLQIWKKERS